MTAYLEREEIRRDNIYSCTLDLIHLLDRQADYNLDAENNPSGTDFVEYFLFDSREGYCVHFASAAVLALRYFGIPARYVTGYTVSPSDFVSDTGGTYTAVITGKQAHAWAEVYLDAIGWVPVEMTPGAVAFPEDNRMEQLGQLGQLAGQGLMLAENEELWQQDKMTWQNDVPEGSNDMEPDRDPVQPVDPDRNKEDLSGLPVGAGREEGDLDNVPGTGGELQQMPAEQEQRTPLMQKTNYRIFIAVLAIFMLLAAFGCLEKWDEKRRRELFVRADRRERIFLLYRNFRRVFQLAGIRRELNVDGEEFRRILEACGRWETYTERNEAGQQVDGSGKNGEWIFDTVTIASPRDIVWRQTGGIGEQYEYYGEDYLATLAGYPGWKGGEYALQADSVFAVGSASAHKEGAWDFLEYILSEEAQARLGQMQGIFPVRKDSFREYLEDDYTDPDYSEPVTATEAEIRRVEEMAEAAVLDDYGVAFDPVWGIVSEEAGMYFSGDAALDATVKKIQTRVQLYLDEM